MGDAFGADAKAGVVDGIGCRTSVSLVQVLIFLIGAHSCALGIVLLFLPRFMLRLFGFPSATRIFFPSQSGIFLLILGIPLPPGSDRTRSVKVILISKTFAITFLFYHAAFLSAPPIIWAAGAGDAAMLVVLTAALWRHRRLTLRGSP